MNGAGSTHGRPQLSPNRTDRTEITRPPLLPWFDKTGWPSGIRKPSTHIIED